MTESRPVATRPVGCVVVRCVVVLPTYEEADNVVRMLRALRTTCPDADILVVDDNSPDGTGKLAEETATELGQISVLHRAGKKGLGAAYRHGFTVALSGDYDAVVSMDIDFSHDPVEIPKMLRLVDEGADLVIGSRYVPGGGTRNWPVHRRLLSRWGNRYTAGVLGLTVRDCTSGFRVYRATALAAIDASTTTADGYAFLSELVRRLVRGGFRVVEHPITFVDREFGTSKMSGPIIRESMLLVTRWGLRDARRAIVGRLRRSR